MRIFCQQKSKRQLEDLPLSTNPRELRKEIYEMVYELHDLPEAVDGLTQDVSQTPFTHNNPKRGEDISVPLSNERTICVGPHNHLTGQGPHILFIRTHRIRIDYRCLMIG